MTFLIDRTLPHHPAHANVLDTPRRRHTAPEDITSPTPQTTPRAHRHFGRRRDLR